MPTCRSTANTPDKRIDPAGLLLLVQQDFVHSPWPFPRLKVVEYGWKDTLFLVNDFWRISGRAGALPGQGITVCLSVST